MESSMKDIIYHYCKMESFFKIISSKTIWLSNAYKTNDFREIKYLLEILQSKYPKIDTDFESFKQEYEEWTKFYMRPHIACFSLEGDLLSQWRGYANDGNGVSIGFDRDYFENISKLENRETKINEIIYEPQHQIDMLIDFMEDIKIEEFARMNRNFDGIASTVLISELIHFGLIFKHPSFMEENEVRIIHGYNELIAESESINYRATTNDLISFVDIPINQNNICPIVEVVLGPKNISDEKDIKDYIQGIYGVDKDIIVKRSESSYR